MSASSSSYSNAKHWCALCKTFIQRDLKSIKFHEESGRHQNKVKRKLAMAAQKKDAQMERNRPSIAQPVPSPLVEPPQQQQIALRADEILGQYSVRGQVYFQGELHEDMLLLPGLKVELSLLDEEGEFAGWADCRLLAYNAWEEDDPYTVRVRMEEGIDQEMQVSASDLRIWAPQTPPQESTQQWTSVAAAGTSSGGSSHAIEVQEEEKPAVEYYKGFALNEDDNEGMEFKPTTTTTTTTTAQQPITFKKRARPPNKT